jgi:hypothetical protein
MRLSFSPFLCLCKCLLVLAGVWGGVKGQTYFNTIYPLHNESVAFGLNTIELDRWYFLTTYGYEMGGGGAHC